MRVWKAVSAAALSAMVSLSWTVGSAGAGCVACDATLNCVGADAGAKFCLQGPLTCTMAVPCIGRGSRFPDSPEEALTTWSLFDAAVPGVATVDVDAGPLSVGEEQRAARAASRAALNDATVAHGSDLSVILSHPSGDGFAVRRAAEGAQVRLQVFDVMAEQPGRLLGEALLGERDRMQVNVRVGGHEQLLVLQAMSVPRAGLGPLLARLRASLRQAARTLPAREEPLLRARAF